jgi:hypothetical protein
LIKGRFDLDTAFQLERKDDTDTISNKWFDLSKTTIRKLIEDGRVQTLMNLYKKEEKKNKNHAQQQLRKFIDTVEKSRVDGEIESHHADFLIKLAQRCRIIVLCLICMGPKIMSKMVHKPLAPL